MGTLLLKMEYLSISNCQQIESFPGGSIPPNLRKVEIRNCEKLMSGQAWVSMDMVTYLWVYGPCDGINSFPKERLLPPPLRFCLCMICQVWRRWSARAFSISRRYKNCAFKIVKSWRISEEKGCRSL
ncbi:hypothetical protein VNO80_01232 [Phaseolus coccineus]|uniref:Uncharacterized protein n=1 Tax=Phaseolus coccineus TaxID=3886 RepID=A0AAN9P0E6_PHACN